MAGAAPRVVTLRDGRIQSDVSYDGLYERDLIALRHSLLGRAMLAGDLALPDELREATPALKRPLEQV